MRCVAFVKLHFGKTAFLTASVHSLQQELPVTPHAAPLTYLQGDEKDMFCTVDNERMNNNKKSHFLLISVELVGRRSERLLLENTGATFFFFAYLKLN